MRQADSFGESALFAETEPRVRQATIQAAKGGAVVLSWSTAAIETLCGFARVRVGRDEATILLLYGVFSEFFS